MSKEEIEEYKEEKERINNQGFERWSWFGIVEKLAHGDITKFEQVEKMNWILALNLLSYWKEKEAEEIRIKKEMKK